jgi:O-acetylhomoserine/O-acetylserine sulfhydrylase-like pyridoxal-dependent enzyme
MNNFFKVIKKHIDKNERSKMPERDNEGRAVVKMSVKNDDSFLSYFSANETAVISSDVAEFLENSPKVEKVLYPGLESDQYRDLAKKYFTNGSSSGVVSFILKGGRASAMEFMKSLKMATNAVHVAAVNTMVLHPASATHRQLTVEQLVGAGVHPGLIRFSVGMEHIEDILDDVRLALEKCE